MPLHRSLLVEVKWEGETALWVMKETSNQIEMDQNVSVKFKPSKRITSVELKFSSVNVNSEAFWSKKMINLMIKFNVTFQPV